MRLSDVLNSPEALQHQTRKDKIMVAGNWITIEFDGMDFTYTDACRLAQKIIKVRPGTIVHLRLDAAVNTSTSALARLVLLRGKLLSKGMDIEIGGLNGRAKALYEINRMKNLLPLRQNGI